ncbi:MAG: class I SAM-dependent methyltransferase [Gammaproteobacteria bacterium]|nr:MAG: class I SAM-dependent methyltransferase [Gammaproteobacteria bacterium]
MTEMEDAKTVPLTTWRQLPHGLLLRNHVERYLRGSLQHDSNEWSVDIGTMSSEVDLTSVRGSRYIRLGWLGDAFCDVHADPQALPLATESVDLIMAAFVLGYCESPHTTLREMHRALRSGGQLVLVEFNPIGLWGIRHWLGRVRQNNPVWQARLIRYRRLRDWCQLLGLGIENHIRLGPWWPFQPKRPRVAASWLTFEWPLAAIGAIQVFVLKKKTYQLITAREVFTKKRLIPANPVRDMPLARYDTGRRRTKG